MGLDMYLYARQHFWTGQEDSSDSQISKKIASLVGTDLEVSDIRATAGYWRKANQIHGWFVKNVQEGEDDCKEYYVSRQNLIDLRDLCERVIADNSLAPTELPTASGFFFGATEYDDWYYKDLADTIKIVDKALTLDKNWSFEYHSSW